jgi:hypothetical protein
VVKDREHQGEEHIMRTTSHVIHAAVAALCSTVVLPAIALAQTASEPAAAVHPDSLVKFLYVLMAGAGAVAVATTVLLAMGRGEMRGRKKMTEGELRMSRQLKQKESEFAAGRQIQDDDQTQ